MRIKRNGVMACMYQSILMYVCTYCMSGYGNLLDSSASPTWLRALWFGGKPNTPTQGPDSSVDESQLETDTELVHPSKRWRFVSARSYTCPNVHERASCRRSGWGRGGGKRKRSAKKHSHRPAEFDFGAFMNA